MAGTLPGSVVFDEAETELIDLAQLILETGWTYEEALSCPLDVAAAVMAVVRGRERVKADGIKRAMPKRK